MASMKPLKKTAASDQPSKRASIRRHVRKNWIASLNAVVDRGMARVLNRIGMPSRNDVNTLSAKLDGLTALLERVTHKQ